MAKKKATSIPLVRSGRRAMYRRWSTKSTFRSSLWELVDFDHVLPVGHRARLWKRDMGNAIQVLDQLVSRLPDSEVRDGIIERFWVRFATLEIGNYLADAFEDGEPTATQYQLIKDLHAVLSPQVALLSSSTKMTNDAVAVRATMMIGEFAKQLQETTSKRRRLGLVDAFVLELDRLTKLGLDKVGDDDRAFIGDLLISHYELPPGSRRVPEGRRVATSILAALCSRYRLLGHTPARSEALIQDAIAEAIRRHKKKSGGQV